MCMSQTLQVASKPIDPRLTALAYDSSHNTSFFKSKSKMGFNVLAFYRMLSQYYFYKVLQFKIATHVSVINRAVTGTRKIRKYRIQLRIRGSKPTLPNFANVQDLRLPYVVSIDFWQYKVEVEDFRIQLL